MKKNSEDYLIAYFDRADNVRYCTASGVSETGAIKASGVSRRKVILIHKKAAVNKVYTKTDQ